MADEAHEAVLADPGAPAPGAAAQPEPQIALTWLARLRWLAPAGQLVAVAAAEWGLGLTLPLVPILALIGLTAVTNAALTAYLARCRPPGWLVPAILLLDVGLLTALLALTGGPQNPFCVLYAVHVAMAVVVASTAWTWGIVAVSVGLFALIVPLHRPLEPAAAAPPMVLSVGSWGALALVLALIAFFCGRLSAALKARDRKLAAMRDAVARSERLASLTTLAAGAAHELGTPLGTIAIAAKELEQRIDDEALSGDARLIRDQADRCRRILDRMNADQLRDAHEAPQRIEASALFEAVAAELPSDAAARVRFDADGIGALAAPPEALARALSILVQNALEADADGTVELAVERSEGWLRFSVTDRGFGIASGTLDRLGDPFVTAKTEGRGMGLGLYLVRLLAEQWHGGLRLASVEGEGTTATLEFPEPEAGRSVQERHE